jgi:NAD(P) transhydrogenase subunit alpha
LETLGILAQTEGGAGAWPLIAVFTVFVIAIFLGLEVISKVPQVLHTPLMSATNAIHGVILVGGILILGKADGPAMIAIGFAAVFFGTMNVVGGYVVTDRMLEMFKARKKPEGSK